MEVKMAKRIRLVCKECKWFIYEPRKIDVECCCCGKLYSDTNSVAEETEE